MNKIKTQIKSLLACVLSISMALSAAACDETQSTTYNNVESTSYGTVWSVPATIKIEKYETDYSQKGVAELSYQAVRNEYENAQLVITAGKDISHFELKTSDLTKGSDVLSGENFTVYVQKYVNYSDRYGSGSMPDALIPMGAADEYEENTIDADSNGALWVTLYVPKETVAGTYEGNFQLMMNGNDGEITMDIPVSVTVYDYTLSDETTEETLYTWRYERVAAGELDGSIEMMTTYYEFFQDYRISLESLPIETLSGEEYVAAVLKYWDKMTSFAILEYAGDQSYTTFPYKADTVMEQILALASESTAERNLFDKAMMYYIDEATISNESTRNTLITLFNKVTAILVDCVDVIEKDTSGLYDNFKQIENWEESIYGIKRVLTLTHPEIEWLINSKDTEEGQALLDILNCIVMKYYSDKFVTALTDLGKEQDLEIWWYGCSGPDEPAGNFHISSKSLLCARNIFWLQLKYGITGNLYWNAAGYTDGSNNQEAIDVYTYPYVRSALAGVPAGDGYLAYPGAAYGIYGPLPSMRLMSIRDGIEEYELLAAVQEKYEALYGSYGENFSSDAVMNQMFYSEIAEDALNIYKDGEGAYDFGDVRERLLQLVCAFDDGVDFALENVERIGNTVKISCFAHEGATLTIDGKVQQAVSGARYQCSLDLTETESVSVVVTNSDGKTFTYEQYIGSPVYTLNSLDDATVLDYITVSKGSVELASTSQHSTDGTSVHVNLNGTVTGVSVIDSNFKPTVTVDTALLGEINLAEMSTVYMDVYNPGENFTTMIRLYSGDNYVEFGNYEIASGCTIVELDLDAEEFAGIETADKIVFEFENMGDDGTALSYEFYVDNIIGG